MIVIGVVILECIIDPQVSLKMDRSSPLDSAQQQNQNPWQPQPRKAPSTPGGLHTQDCSARRGASCVEFVEISEI